MLPPTVTQPPEEQDYYSRMLSNPTLSDAQRAQLLAMKAKREAKKRAKQQASMALAGADLGQAGLSPKAKPAEPCSAPRQAGLAQQAKAQHRCGTAQRPRLLMMSHTRLSHRRGRAAVPRSQRGLAPFVVLS